MYYSKLSIVQFKEVKSSNKSSLPTSIVTKRRRGRPAKNDPKPILPIGYLQMITSTESLASSNSSVDKVVLLDTPNHCRQEDLDFKGLSQSGNSMTYFHNKACCSKEESSNNNISFLTTLNSRLHPQPIFNTTCNNNNCHHSPSSTNNNNVNNFIMMKSNDDNIDIDNNTRRCSMFVNYQCDVDDENSNFSQSRSIHSSGNSKVICINMRNRRPCRTSISIKDLLN
ncbi:predicted protein [Naegleria gruberi]|uniref:Predicted protein n=1 Tax=Naegleria gruberi TaxID=5762 RepID=D2W2E5_NAEGR|nr:uncharacterized protein NAEGRDRAFT_76411 [Naegleria gruberi]XP_002669444.1 uncharacterized protein NAEGRDRAFT_75560 [Naegleria gruberi]EFC35928.1 predicted protein [Naegleria gruberi]EFC36700.1 predicted protein [Naegleria gruberi]|eukprot:XP_002668672.1 predicted protein [Naegleria gruberi strain NEG-M]